MMNLPKADRYRLMTSDQVNQDVVSLMLVAYDTTNRTSWYADFSDIKWIEYQEFDLLPLTLAIPGHPGTTLEDSIVRAAERILGRELR